ncbi:MAG: HAD family hydrolase [Lachnospiraceae bacterium]|jgi:phosphoglycolate phosphatase|nr:HAD family hydrolase [Lachnospiraceae bacterium]MCI1327450.1 HAD family hydrolase [Lachnospiraceae bacterium]
MPDGIIFDIDGTMWDSRAVIAEAWNRILAGHGEPAHLTPEILKHEFGKTLEDIGRDLMPDLSDEARAPITEQMWRAEPEAVRTKKPYVYEGLGETLKALSERTKLFIVSNAMPGYIESFLDVTGFDRFFTDHLCNGDTGRPKGDNIAQMVKKHGLCNPVYVGDTQGDCDAAAKAVVRFAYASYGFGTVTHCDYHLEKVSDLLRYFL